ncbi:MAG TPA: nucleotide exchange factor GrpE [Thermomicrobiales bacterium]|nr:nucleotide exchange factor GrpE [Thermomicrobiales bacterium]
MTDTQNPPVASDTTLGKEADANASGSDIDFDAVVAERDRYLDQLQRTAADFANYRRRVEQERAQQRLAANEQLLREFVPVLDDLQRGLSALPPDQQESKLAEGMRWVEQKFLTTLKKHGVTPIESLGQAFDPSVHEAVEADPAGGDTVVAVYAPGYRLGDGILRPAMVKVGPGEDGKMATQQDGS